MNETSGEQHILRLKTANQIEPRLERSIMPFEQ